MRIFSRILPLFISLVFFTPALATTVMPVSLEHMSKAAALIFHGRVTANEVKIDDATGRVATFTSFEVLELIKGQAGDTHTIKQLGGHLPGSEHVNRIHGVPRFTVGIEYVVFLPEASDLGFASPIGLSQGQFTVQQEHGVTTVSNGRAIRGLLPETPALPRGSTATLRPLPDQPASAALADFMQSVRELASE